ncbi:DNA-3-methyladenine glycosylase family protein, partial [Liberiplasma polymorphum]|uniref:DNA-3-methyladenine glycosylase family protein n=1 Tax=Liberiplasma polymorphum TaxID=3374570 RepID=UPI003771FBEA
GQQLSNQVMQVLIKRFDDAFSPLTRDHLSQFSVSDFKAVGLSLSKSETIKRIIDAPTDYDELTHQPNDQIIKVLTKIKGLGPWSTDMFIMFIKGDPDYFSIYDGGINSAIESFYEGFYPEDFKEHYSPYGTYACFYLWESLNHKALITKTIKNHLEESLKWKNI